MSAIDDEDVQLLTALGEKLVLAVFESQPLGEITDLIEAGAPVWYQTEGEGMSPLHAAAYAQNADIIPLLLEKGAVWNAVDHLKNTAADIALSFNDEKMYTLIRDAGIRSEMLLSLLNSKSSLEAASTLILKPEDASAAASTDAFLQSKLRFTTDDHGQDVCLVQVQSEEIGVMMGWETEIMQETVRRLCDGHENEEQLKVLNVGFGLGIIDSLFEARAHAPTLHVIIEPHPDVLDYMKSKGWYDRPNVRILEGKWQDMITDEAIIQAGGFDVVYTDTFSEDYQVLHEFFEHLPDILAGPSSRFSFFNGLGATNMLFYDVYTHLSELHLVDVGLDVAWSDVEVARGRNRWGDTRVYFSLPIYRLPVGRMAIM